MAVLIDPPIWPARGRRWSHLASDASLRELHDFAAALGIPERGFEGDHYDVPEERYPATVAAGAIPVSSRELLRRLQGSGLRRPKRRGERVLASRLGDVPDVRIDAVLSALAPIGPVHEVHAVLASERRLLVLPDDVGYRLPHEPLAGPDAADAVTASRALAVRLVGPAAALAPVVQVGYVRSVRIRGGRVIGNDVVLRLTLHGAVPGEPADGAAWVPAQQAVALLAGDVVPLAAGAAFRPPERAARGEAANHSSDG